MNHLFSNLHGELKQVAYEAISKFNEQGTYKGSTDKKDLKKPVKVLIPFSNNKNVIFWVEA